MRVDYHIHTSLCHHAEGKMEEYADRAKQLGLDEIGFSDHFPLDLLGVNPKHPVTMSGDQFDGYIKEVERLRNHFSFPIRLGTEIDIIPGSEKRLQNLLPQLSLDYCIGSLHFLGDWDFTHPDCQDMFWQADLEQIYDDYFKILGDAAAGGLFDIIGHPDVIKKFGFQPAGGLERYYRKFACQLSQGGTCVELNTSGAAAPVGEQYPAFGLLKVCRAEGIPVTIGSDAHRPQDVGRGWELALRMLRAAGYKEITLFKDREKIQCPLPWK